MPILTPEQQAALDKSKTVVSSAEEALERLKTEGITDPVTPVGNGDKPPVIRYDETESETEKFFSGLDVTAPTVKEQETIRSDIRSRMQNQIDAIEQAYGRLIGRAEEAGTEAEARQRAISSRAGLLGSLRGEAQKEKVKEITKGQVEAYEDERTIKVNVVLGNIEQAAIDKIEAETAKAEGNMEKYLLYQEKAQTDARTNMAGLAESGISLDRLKLAAKEDGETGDFYAQLLEDTGWSDLQFDAMYNLAMPEDEQIKYDYTWKGDNLIAIGIDPATGKLTKQSYTAEELGIPSGTDIDFITNENTGEMFWYDKNDPTNDDGTLKTTSMGKMKEVKATGFDEATDEEWGYLRSAFKNATSDAPGTQEARDVARFNELMASGDTIGAKEYIVKRAIETAGQSAQDAANGRSSGAKALLSIKAEMAEYIDNGGDMNIFEGTKDAVSRKIDQVENKDLRKLASKMNLALIDYRASVTGAQFSDKENQQYKNVYPDIMNSFDVNEAQIDALIEVFTLNQKSFLESRIGETTYDRVFGGESAGDDGRIKVKVKETGQEGTIDASEFDESIYERI